MRIDKGIHAWTKTLSYLTKKLISWGKNTNASIDKGIHELKIYLV